MATVITIEGERTSLLIQQAAVLKIERWWISLRNKKFFKLLKAVVCSAEHSLTYEVLRKLSPRESVLLKDPAMKSTVKFRLDGTKFPPAVVFKIYSKAQSIKYINGKNLFRPKTEAAEDARQQMGNRIYCDQLVSDSTRHHQYAITELHDIGTIKDYMKYSANLDETPAIYGGRENYWRQLDLNDLPRHSISMFIRPLSSTGSIDTLLPRTNTSLATSLQRLDTTLSTATTRRKISTSNTMSEVGNSRERGRKLAMRRVEKMKRSYTTSDSHYSKDITGISPSPNGLSPSPDGMSPGPNSTSPGLNDDVIEDDSEVLQLYKWTQDLSLEDLN